MSCLFRSLSYYIQNVNENELRDIIVDYLEKDPILIGQDTHLKDILKVQNTTISCIYHTLLEPFTYRDAVKTSFQIWRFLAFLIPL